jgi:hypothetical protein
VPPKKRQKKPSEPWQLLVERFGLDSDESELLARLWGEQRLTVGEHAALLEPRGRLRRHALAHVSSEHGEIAPPLRTDALQLAPGIFRAESLAISVTLVDAKDESHPPSPRAIQVVRGELVSANPRVAALDACTRREAYGLAVTLARFAARPVLFADGEALIAQRVSWTLLAALRREADLTGAALVIAQAAALGEKWRALAAPPPAAPLHPPLVVLIGGRDLAAVDGLETISIALPVTAIAPTPEKPQAREDGFDSIRQQAVRDAGALAGLRPQTARPPIAAPPSPSPAPSAPAPSSPPAQASAPAQPAAPVKRSRKGEMYFGEGGIANPQQPAPAAAPAEASSENPAELARLSTTSPDASVRIDAINKLAAFRSPAAVAALRANVRSEHAGVREAAERAMAELFGPEWNRTRPVAKPVQPPRSDD